MEYVDGERITSYCDRHVLDLAQRIDLFIEVCEALHHAHEKGIIHRDLKPSNILVIRAGERSHPKVIDFGVARALNQRLTERTLYTEFGRVVGTPTYMSPEQAGLIGSIDRRSDVYSLGVILFELLTGELPQDWDEMRRLPLDQILRRIREEKTPRPSHRVASLQRDPSTRDQLDGMARRRGSSGTRSLVRALSTKLDWIVIRALEKEPARRYATALELARDLRAYRAGGAIVAGPPGVFELTAGFSRRYARELGALVCGTVLLVIVAVVSLGSTRAANDLESERLASETARAAILEDANILDELEATSRNLWFDSIESIEAADRWLARARALSFRLTEHRRTLERWRRMAAGRTDALSSRDEKLLALVTDFAARLEHFASRGEESGKALRLIERRRAASPSALELERLWEQAARSIADRSICPAYDGLEIVPQDGLIPIGRDRDSGLSEFWHPRSGARPQRDGSGKLAVEAESGIVFVLLAGGEFTMGAEPPSADRPFGLPNVDPGARVRNEKYHHGEVEQPIHRVELSPFFLSKFEVTQSQWMRLTDSNPSAFPPEHSGTSLAHPLDGICWYDAVGGLARFGLRLPTEAQWEYAARGGTTTIWWTGDDRSEIEAAEVLRHVGPTARVGSRRANPFGLFDISGNVQEWCGDGCGDYANPPRAGDGARPRGDEPDGRPARGGDWADDSLGNVAFERARSARRWCAPSNRSGNVGVRPARVLDEGSAR